MPTLPNMSLITPTLGGDSGTWDDKINACFGLVDAHDHTTGKGVAVPVSGLNINADLPMAGNGFTNLGKIGFTTIAAPSNGSKNLFVNSADNELYWRTNSGTNVKLTNGTSINTTLVGGIVGDYSTVGAEVAYDDANKRYTFKDQSSPTKKWARLAAGSVRIYESETTESVYIEHATDPALASSYIVLWPAALPAARGPVVMTAGGSLEFVGAQNLTLGPALGAGNANATLATGEWQLGTGGLGFVWYSIPLPEGATITGFSFRLNKASDNTNTISAVLYRIVDGVATDVSTQTNNANAPGNITLSATGLSSTIAAGQVYQIRIFNNDATPSATDRVYNGYVTYS